MDTYDEISRAKYAALFYLSRRALTERQLREKLEKKEYSPEIIDETLEYVKELGYIDDRDYAQRYAKDAVELKRHGVSRIRMDLRKKGICPQDIDEALQELSLDTSDALRSLIEEKSAALDLKDKKHRVRLVNFLLRRGYKFDEINSALREMEEFDFD
jgi:regulatory protein